MNIINWNDSLSVKIKSIDDQHKILIDMINSFYDKITKNEGKEGMLTFIDGLKKYVLLHFSTEEKYFKQFNYPAYEAHKKEHDKFIAQVNDFETRYKNGKLILSVEITNFIKDWITNHIMGIDKKYSDFLIQKGIK